MREAFTPSTSGVRVRLGADERHLLADLLGDLDELLEPDGAASRPRPSDGAPSGDDDIFAALVATIEVPQGPPSDPAVARLLPEAHRDDPEVAADFRRLSEATVRDRKRRNATGSRALLVQEGPLTLAAAEALALMKSLTDLRLVLANRLGIEADDDVELLFETVQGLDDPALGSRLMGTLALYETLGWWQDSLIRAVEKLT